MNRVQIRDPRSPLRVSRATAAALALAGVLATLPAATARAAMPGTGAGDDSASLHEERPYPAMPAARVTDHVVIISLDGLRPDAIEKFHARTLQKLIREGSSSLQASTILPSKTLPSHTSMLTGVDVDVHHIDWNVEAVSEHGHVDVPTVFKLASERGMRTAAFFSKTKFHHLEVPNSIDYVRSPAGGIADYRWGAVRTLQQVEYFLESGADAPDLMFVHLGDPDYAGHMFGWMSHAYGKAVQEADIVVREMLSEMDEKFGKGNYTVIVTADHGGHGRNHGSSDARDTTIPWIVWGKGVQGSTTLPAGIRTMDTAATALWLLGVVPPREWEGRAVAAAFTAGSVASAY